MATKQVVVYLGLINRTIEYLQELGKQVEGYTPLRLSVMNASLTLEMLKRDLAELMV